MSMACFKTWLERLHDDERGDVLQNLAIAGVGAAMLGFLITVIFPKVQKFVTDGVDVLVNWRPY
jgi:hypothetical protein